MMGKAYKTTVCKMLDIRQWRSVIFERWETNEVSPMIAIVYKWENFQLCAVQGRGAQTEFCGLSELRKWSWESGDTNVARIHRTDLERGENIKDLRSWVFNWVVIKTNMWRICLWLGANILQITVTHSPQGLRIASAIASPGLECLGAHMTVSRMGNNYPQTVHSSGPASQSLSKTWKDQTISK